MGVFSWIYSNTGKQMVLGKEKASYLLVPNGFGENLVEYRYDGYGKFSGQDVYVLVADWNRAFFSKNPDWVNYHGKKIKDQPWYQDYIDGKSHQEIEAGMQENDPYFKYRYIGIYMGCYNEDNERLQYPIKIVDEPMSYNDAMPSTSDPHQGYADEEPELDEDNCMAYDDKSLIDELRRRGYTVLKDGEPLRLQTSAGELRAYRDTSAEYPGISILFQPKKMEYEFSVFSAEIHEEDKDDTLYGYTYEDVFSECVTRRFDLKSSDYKKLQEELKRG